MNPSNLPPLCKVPWELISSITFSHNSIVTINDRNYSGDWDLLKIIKTDQVILIYIEAKYFPLPVILQSHSQQRRATQPRSIFAILNIIILSLLLIINTDNSSSYQKSLFLRSSPKPNQKEVKRLFLKILLSRAPQPWELIQDKTKKYQKYSKLPRLPKIN